MTYYRHIMLLLLCCVSPDATNAQMGTDTSLINVARSILQAGPYCDSAMKCLQQVSTQGKETGWYYLLIAEIYECKQNPEYAHVYYEYALKAQPGNKLALSKLGTSNSSLPAKNAQAPALDRENEKIRKQTTEFVRSEKESIYDTYFGWALGGSRMIGGKKAMAVQSIYFSMMLGWPVMDGKFLIDISPTIGVVWGRNPRWYTTPAFLKKPVVVGDGTGFCGSLEPSFSYVLLNSRRHGIAGGAILGYQLINNEAWVQRINGEVTNSTQHYIVFGPKVAYFGWQRLYFSAEFLHVGIRKIRASIEAHSELRPVNLDLLRFTLGVRFLSGSQ